MLKILQYLLIQAVPNDHFKVPPRSATYIIKVVVLIIGMLVEIATYCNKYLNKLYVNDQCVQSCLSGTQEIGFSFR